MNGKCFVYNILGKDIRYGLTWRCLWITQNLGFTCFVSHNNAVMNSNWLIIIFVLYIQRIFLSKCFTSFTTHISKNALRSEYFKGYLFCHIYHTVTLPNDEHKIVHEVEPDVQSVSIFTDNVSLIFLKTWQKKYIYLLKISYLYHASANKWF